MATNKQATKPAAKKGSKANPHVLEGAAKKLEGGTQPVDPMQAEAERRHDMRRASDVEQSNAAMAFAVQQMTTPAAVDPNRAAFEAEIAKLAEKYKQPLPTAVVKASQPKVQANGITRPKADTLCGRIWHAADQITVQQGRPATVAELGVHPALNGVNAHTKKTQYARWRAFNGVSGRIDTTPKPGVVMTHEGNP